MSTPMAVQVARWSRRGLSAAVALALSLACIVFAVAASATPMTGMVDMADASTTAAATAAPAAAVGAFTSGPTGGVVGEVVPEAAAPVAMISLPLNSMCERACVTNVSEMCTIAGGLTVTTLLALLLATRRDTFVGLLARKRPCALPRQQRRQTPWTVLSPISLCVFRV